MQPAIEHVSDTALMVAACRALETDLDCGLIRDPLARRVAGERGIAILANTSSKAWMQFGIGVRTRFMDELVMLAIADGVDTVVNLGAGLDTRPWRLDLPADLLWVEVDFPDMLAYKDAALEGVAPHCRLERMSADLNQPAERAAALNRARGRSLLMTEGLLMYLPGETVDALAKEGLGRFSYWLMDINSRELMKMAHGDFLETLNRVSAESRLDGPEILDLVQKTGWSVAEKRTYFAETTNISPDRVALLMQALGITPDPNAPRPADVGSGVWLFRSDS